MTIAAAALAAAIAMPTASAAEMAGADIVGTDGAVIGFVHFEQTPTGVLMYVNVSGLPPGGHGIHLHAVGSCTPNFKAVTGHINPGKVKHGLRNPEGPDNGDLPTLLDEDGSAVIIHENPDDHMAQPIGGAGGRIGCGVIAKM